MWDSLLRDVTVVLLFLPSPFTGPAPSIGAEAGASGGGPMGFSAELHSCPGWPWVAQLVPAPYPSRLTPCYLDTSDASIL